MHTWQWVFICAVVIQTVWILVVLLVVDGIKRRGGAVPSNSWHYRVYCVASDTSSFYVTPTTFIIHNTREYRDTLLWADLWCGTLLLIATFATTFGFLMRLVNMLAHWLLFAEIVDRDKTPSLWKELFAFPDVGAIEFCDIPNGHRNPWWIVVTVAMTLVIIFIFALTT